MRRLMFITETNSASLLSINDAITMVRGEIKDVWSYAGYEDILKDDSNINKSIKVRASLIL